MIKTIENNSIIIIPNNKKNDLIKQLNQQLLNIKIMSMEELIKKFTFDYNEKTIFELMTQENINYDIAENYIKNIYYIENKNYHNPKLNKLVEIKNYLQKQNLLIYDSLFKNYIKNKKIYILYDYITKYENQILNEINQITEVKKLEINYQNYTPVIHEFATINEEVNFVAYNICALIDKGIDINKIKLVNVSKEYYHEIKKTFKFYNIPINIEKKRIYGTKIINDFIKNYQEDINDTLKYIQQNYNLNNEQNLEIYNQLINILNEYSWCSNYIEIKELIINKLKTKTITPLNNNAIEITNLENITDEYTFILNFNQGNMPKIYKDEDYIDDLTKQKLNLETAIEKNIIEKEKTIKQIKNIKNCTITYKLKTPFASFYPSSIIEELNTDVIKKHEISNISYSEINDQITLTKKLDNLIKYGIKDDTLETLYANYQIPYLTYNNQYTKINKDALNNYLNDKLLLSYSSMDNYYHCAFKYYINNILKLNPYEETFATKIGTLFHTTLEQTLKNNDDYKKYWDQLVSSLQLTNKEKFFIDLLEETIQEDIKTIREQLKYCQLKETKYEEKIYVNNAKVTFMGIIDKLMYQPLEDKTVVALIDYKTGNTSIDLNRTYYGLSLQLPTYLYLASNSNLKNIKIAGFYIQNIIPKRDEENDALKLKGFSTTDKEILKQFDNAYENSNMIKGMRTKTDGEFYSYTKVLTNQQMDNLINLVDQKIKDASTNILNAEFNINPKQIGYGKDALVGCEYCTFKDLCFKQEKDIVHLKEQDYHQFLGGEENA